VAHRDGRNRQAICARELRAIGAAIRWAVSYPSIINARLLVLGDSLAVLGALQKGRSSAFSLRALLRPIAAMLLSANVSLRLL